MIRIFCLKKIPVKGGWTYATIPEELPDKHSLFGWVKGTIDGFELKKRYLLPMGNGKLGLSVKAKIRKKIEKQTGDYVHVILYPDNEPVEVPEELLLCLKDEREAFLFFNSLDESEQNSDIKWIYSAKSDDNKVQRIAETLNRLCQNLKYEGTHRGTDRKYS